MYIGRIVSVGMTPSGRLCAAYRVSSRSFPNRTAVVRPEAVSIIPKPGFEADVQKNPYIAYNCARIVCNGAVAVVTNGSHTDPIAEKMAMGMSARDAMALSTLALDYEKDSYNTPRVTAVVDARSGGSAWLGVVRHDALSIVQMPVKAGQYFYVATYEENAPSLNLGGAFPAETAAEACAFMLNGGIFAERTNAVTAVAAVANKAGDGFELAVQDMPQA